MLINSIKIQKFRGIRDDLELDLSSPLTILHAANGTGKTSICDAVEWTFSNHVKRLQTNDISEVRCRYGDEEKQTSVEIEIQKEIDREIRKFTFKRDLEKQGEAWKSPLYRKELSQSYALVNDLDLLGLFVPEVSSNKRGAKADWMYSTRFLESDSLKLLIDQGNDSQDARKLIFSNLFGVKQYQETQKKLTSILDKLPKARTIKSDKEKAAQKIKSLKDKIDALAKDESTPHFQNSKTYLLKIISKLSLEINFKEDEEIQTAYSSVEIEIIKLSKKLEREKEALTFVKGELANFSQNKKKSQENAKKIDEREESAKKIREILEKKAQEKKTTAAKGDSAKRKADLLSRLLSEAQALIDEREELLSKHIFTFMEKKEEETELETLKRLLLASEQLLTQLERKLKLLESCIDLYPTLEGLTHKEKGLDIEIVSLTKRLNDYLDVVPIEEALAHVKSQLESLKENRRKVVQELDFVLTSGQKYIESRPDVSECPLCEHDHASNEGLLHIINRRVKSLSEESVQEAKLTEEEKSLSQKLERQKKINERLISLKKEKEDIGSKIKLIKDSCKDAGFELGHQQGQDVPSELRDSASKTKEAIKDLIKKQGIYKNNLYVAEHIKTNAQNFTDNLRQYEEEYPNSAIAILKAEDPHKEFIVELEKSKSACATELMDIGKQQRELDREVLGLQARLDEEDLALKEHKKQEKSLIEKINLVNTKWKILSSKDLTSSFLDIEENKAQRKTSSLEEVQSLLTKAKEYIDQGREIEKKEKEKNIYVEQIEEEQGRIGSLEQLQNYRDALEKQIEAIKGDIKEFVASQIKPLTDIICTLYLRAQGNRFVNLIKAAPNSDGIIDWIAELDSKGEKLENMLNLSQGQRQDLALAIFLARARSLGGTFFLDEPFVHLDDLNRVALLDTLRVIVSEQRSSNPLRLVITTASNNLVRHLREKFSLVEVEQGQNPVTIYNLNGNPKVGLKYDQEKVHSPINLFNLRPIA